MHFFQGGSKEKTATMLLDHEQKLFEARDKDELGEVQGYLLEISKSLKAVSIWMYHEKTNLSQLMQDDLIYKVHKFR
jgi:hypothetical protein